MRGGYLTSSVKGLFRQCYGVDVSAGMLSYYPVSPGVKRIKSSLDKQSAILTNQIKPNIILSLAGIHHIYEIVDGEVYQEQSEALQETVILGWARSLTENGFMVIADVTKPDIPPVFPGKAVELESRNVLITERLKQLVEPLARITHDFDLFNENIPKTFAEYSNRLLAKLPTVAKSQPGLWFRNIVAERGIYGHIDYFLNAPKICETLIGNGFDVQFYELPTPWIFNSLESFLYFFYEKFGFGPQVDSFDEIPTNIRLMIKTECENYLGITNLKGGAVSVGWRLGYYIVRKPVKISDAP